MSALTTLYSRTSDSPPHLGELFQVAFAQSKLRQQARSLTEQHSIPNEYIEIELTESTIFNNEEALGKLLHELHEVGFPLSMDDFGTGYSSLGLLKNHPVNVLKIDKLFFAMVTIRTAGGWFWKA